MTLTPILFDIGETFATPGALAALEAAGENPYFYLGRHVTGDWGRISPVDTAANMLALATGTQIVSSYRTRKGVKFLIATAADRSTTYLFLPEDYTPESADEHAPHSPHARPDNRPSVECARTEQ